MFRRERTDLILHLFILKGLLKSILILVLLYFYSRFFTDTPFLLESRDYDINGPENLHWSESPVLMAAAHACPHLKFPSLIFINILPGTIPSPFILALGIMNLFFYLLQAD